MATTATLNSATLYEVTYTVTVDAAGGTAQKDPITDMTGAGVTTGPLLSLFKNGGVAVASQAAARLLVEQNCRITIRDTAAAIGAGPAAGLPRPLADQNISGGAANNFRFDFSALKQHGNNTMTYIVMFEFRHSIEA